MKKCNCGREMEKLPDQPDKLIRYRCSFCRRSVTCAVAPENNERTRTQHGLGMKRNKWL